MMNGILISEKTPENITRELSINCPGIGVQVQSRKVIGFSLLVALEPREAAATLRRNRN